MKLKEIIDVLTPTADSLTRGFKVITYLLICFAIAWVLLIIWPYILMAAMVIILVGLTGKGSMRSREFVKWLKKELYDLTGKDNNDTTGGGGI